VEKAARSKVLALRIEAAKIAGRLDRSPARDLLVREFGGRYLSPCRQANDALNELYSETRRVECTDPVERARAADAWRASR
jgi:hypothetical protein